MEFKRFLNMYHISVVWINIIYLSVAYSTINNFPYDLIAENSDNVAPKENDKTKADDEKRTLSQQVAEGKYGLLHKEIFSKPIQRPGVISYTSNNEVPNDNASNFGGLNKSDIWLAENHLLVIKGGSYPLLEIFPEYSKPIWPPIDDYNAPRRQVKIPKNPKVPPPFLVQLADGGPLQILGTNYSRNINDTFYPPKHPIPSLEGNEPGTGGPFYPPEYPYPPNTSPGKTPFPGSPNPSTLPGSNEGNSVITRGSFLPPFFDALPPGLAILPPPNITDQYDEDDLSVYYPPPYSFYYPTDNTTKVPPGPLVPGIVLPPPPDFFGPLEKTTTTTTPKPTTTTRKPSQRTKPSSITKLRPVKPKPSTIYIYDNHIPRQPFEKYGPPPAPKKISITATKLPLNAYYTTSYETDYGNNKQPENQIYYYDPNAPETNSIPARHPSASKNRANNSNNYILQPHFYYLSPPVNNFKTHIVELEEQLRSYENPNQFQENTYQKPDPKPVYQYSFEVSNYKEQRNKLQGSTRPKYTVQIEPAIELTTTPTPTYYQQPHYNYQTPQAITTNPNVGYIPTANPLYNNPYTKQEDKYFDDITKTYFTTFGKRLKATTPLPLVQQYSITDPRINIEAIKAINIQNYDYKIRPSAETYLSETNPETIPSPRIPNHSYQRPIIQNNYNDEDNQQYNRIPKVQTINVPSNQQFVPIRQQKGNNANQYLHIIKPEPIEEISIPARQHSYAQVGKQQNSQTIHAISLEPDNKPGSFISYQLPGDEGAHFYFLTPQLAQNEDSQNIRYYYPQSSSSRIPGRS